MWNIPGSGTSVTSLAIAAATVLTVASCATDGGKGSANAGSGAEPTGDITIGLLTSMTGPAGLFGPATKNVAELAADEINAWGGVLGRMVRVVVGDAATNPDTGRQAATRLIQSDGASVLVGMHSSATRESALPVARSADTLYLYTPVFEGGTCDAHLFTNGEVPSQQLQQAIPWVEKTTGKNKWFLIGDDYVWGHKSLEMAERQIVESGGQVAGKAFVPLGTTDFQAVIQKIQQADPDLVIPALVGGDAIAFEKQAFNAGVGNAAVQRLAILYEENTLAGMGPDVAAGMFTSLGYFQDLDTPANTAFRGAYMKKFGAQAPPVTSLSEQTYVAIKAWAQAANAAKSVAGAAVSSKLAGMSLDAPAGTVTFEQNRFATQPIFIGKARTGGGIKIEQTFPAVKADETCSPK
jgi:ABC-type branched-subunit amino acid transport system substrate-binding protein